MLKIEIKKNNLSTLDHVNSKKTKLKKKLQNLILKQLNIEGWNWRKKTLNKKIELLEGETEKKTFN
jgi:hypothetical protein